MNEHASGQPVSVPDVTPPAEPASELDALIAYLEGPYPARKQSWRELAQQASQLKDRGSMIALGYECLLFRSELDPFLALATQLYEAEHGNQLTVTHDERKSEQRRPTGEVLKAQARVFTAPLKRALKELTDMQDLLSKTLSWCQTQQKALSSEEYGELFSSSNQAPTRSFAEVPATSAALRRVAQR